jgi:hypothetical protein
MDVDDNNDNTAGDNTAGDSGKRRRTSQYTSLALSLAAKPKKTWSQEEDEKLKQLINTNGEGNWSYIATCMGGRSGKQCRERWHNHLSPAVNKSEWTEEEDRIIREMRKVVGNQWSLMRKYLVGRSDNAIKNRFNAAERCKGIKVKKPKADNNDEQSLDSENLEKASFDMDNININRFDTDKTAMFTEDDFSGLNENDFDCLFADDFNFDFIDDAKMEKNEKSSSSAWDCDGCSTIKQSVDKFLKPKLDIVEKDTKDRLL